MRKFLSILISIVVVYPHHMYSLTPPAGLNTIIAEAFKESPCYFYGADLEGNNLTDDLPPGVNEKQLLGDQGLGLREMVKAGLPVPPGFTVTTDEARKTNTNGGKLEHSTISSIIHNIQRLEKATKQKFGDKKNPLMVSVCSGAAQSMPGMPKSILNIGMTREIAEYMATKSVANARFAWDCYRRLLHMFGVAVFELDGDEFLSIMNQKKSERGVKLDTELTVHDLWEVVEQYEVLYARHDKKLPQDPHEQLQLAVEAVFRASYSGKAVTYREILRISNEEGISAANVVKMVFGNYNDQSATGVCFTRDPSTGENILYGDFLINAQGEDVVAGIRNVRKIKELEQAIPSAFKQLMDAKRILEENFKDMEDLEFTVENERFYLLGRRTGKRSPAAALNIACDLVEEGIIDKQEAIMRVSDEDLVKILHPNFDAADLNKARTDNRVLTTGIGAVSGAAVGQVVFDKDAAIELSKQGKPVIFMKKVMNPDEYDAVIHCQGVVTATGGKTSHAAVVTRGKGIPCVVGAGELTFHDDNGSVYATIGDTRINEGDIISLNGSTGEVIKGEVKKDEAIVLKGISGERLSEEDQRLFDNLQRLFSWVDENKKLGIRMNADTPEDVKKGIAYGAEGIGLVRTEHMFSEDRREGEERSLKFQMMILGDDFSRGALAELEEMQKNDFIAIIKALNGRPGTIRLFDPPLHEFLPDPDEGGERIELLAKKMGLSTDEIIRRINKQKEKNPMAGFRGPRLLMVHPELADMQIRALLAAQADRQLEAQLPPPEGIDRRVTAQSEVHAPAPIEIMIPFIGVVDEFIFFEKRIEQIVKKEFGTFTRGKDYLIGTMIETPSAAIMADTIAEHADFFSFGTNDLTQFCLKFSRDDAGKIVIPAYMEQKILRVDPFETIDELVGELIRIAVTLGRKANPNLKIGLCGEQGGNPQSISETIIPSGINYSSCSPPRVLIARLAAAQAHIRNQRAGKEDVEPYDMGRIEIFPEELQQVDPAFTEDIMQNEYAIDALREIILLLNIQDQLETDGVYFRDTKDHAKLEVYTELLAAKKDKLLSVIGTRISSIIGREWAVNHNPQAFIRLFNLDFGAVFNGLDKPKRIALANELEVTQVRILEYISKLHESNPELGNIGVRQALTGYEDIFKAQIEAVIDGINGEISRNLIPQIIVPVLIDAGEFARFKEMVYAVAKEKGIDTSRFSLGATIETPRAALDAAAIAKEADFVIFNTIGLVDSTLSITRDDAQRFLPVFLRHRIYEHNPYSVVPQSVRRMVGLAVGRIRNAGQELPIYYYGHSELDLDWVLPYAGSDVNTDVVHVDARKDDSTVATSQ